MPVPLCSIPRIARARRRSAHRAAWLALGVLVACAASRPPPARADGAENDATPPSAFAEWWDGDALTGTWLAVRTAADEHGVAFEGSVTSDLSRVLDGGLEERGAGRALFDLALRVDLERLGGLEGVTAFADFQALVGDNGSEDVGDIQGYSSIDARELAQLSELWLEVVLFEDRLRIKVGKVDANTEFGFAENAAAFLQSSMGMSPTTPMPTYPDPASSVTVFLSPVSWAYAGVGVYDGASYRGVHTGSCGPRTALTGHVELFTIGEAGMRWGEDGMGRLALGGWYLDGGFDVTSANGAFEHHHGTRGAYAVLDQRLWKELDEPGDPQGLVAFGMWGWTEPSTSPIEAHLGGGLAWRGPIAGRDEDELGVGASWVSAGDALDPPTPRDHEVAVEIYYAAPLAGWLVVQPDLQWITSPLGDPTARDAWVGTVRVTLNL